MNLVAKNRDFSCNEVKLSSELIQTPYSLNDIKEWRITNLEYIEWVKDEKLWRIRLRIKWIDEKEKQIYYNFSDYLNNWILDENKLILDIIKKKSELIEMRRSVTKLKTKEILDETWKVLWVRIEKNNGRLLFAIELTHNGNKKKTWVRINPDNFDESFEKMIEKYKTVWTDVGYKEMNFMQSFNLFCSKQYYEDIFEKKHKEIEFEKEKESLIFEWLITESARVNQIALNGRSFILKDDNGKKILQRDIFAHGEESAFEQVLTKFCFNHGIEFRGDIWNWIFNNRKLVRKEYQNK